MRTYHFWIGQKLPKVMSRIREAKFQDKPVIIVSDDDYDKMLGCYGQIILHLCYGWWYHRRVYQRIQNLKAFCPVTEQIHA